MKKGLQAIAMLAKYLVANLNTSFNIPLEGGTQPNCFMRYLEQCYHINGLVWFCVLSDLIQVHSQLLIISIHGYFSKQYNLVLFGYGEKVPFLVLSANKTLGTLV